MNEITIQDIVQINECSCGAVSVLLVDGKEYYCKKENLQKFFPTLTEEEIKTVTAEITYGNCNHCVNHWGLDICCCGSGEEIGTCDCGKNRPFQIIGEDDYQCENTWI